MNEVLERCFCGSEPFESLVSTGKVSCNNPPCQLYMPEFYPEDWNELQEQISRKTVGMPVTMEVSRDLYDSDLAATLEMYDAQGFTTGGVNFYSDGKIVWSLVRGNTVVDSGTDEPSFSGMSDDEIAIRILALDEEENVDIWLQHWRKLWPEMKAETEHSGDCTKQPWTCTACVVEHTLQRVPDYRRLLMEKR